MAKITINIEDTEEEGVHLSVTGLPEDFVVPTTEEEFHKLTHAEKVSVMVLSFARDSFKHASESCSNGDDATCCGGGCHAPEPT